MNGIESPARNLLYHTILSYTKMYHTIPYHLVARAALMLSLLIPKRDILACGALLLEGMCLCMYVCMSALSVSVHGLHCRYLYFMVTH